MNLSAHWTRFTFLGLTALSAGALAIACTVTTGNIDDFDGGTGSNTKTDSGSNGDSGGATDTDSGSDGGTTPAACEGNTQTSTIGSEACQACLNTQCCSQLVGCFNLDPGSSGDGGKNASCEEYYPYYEQCAADCETQNPDGGTALDDCIKDTCRAAAGNPAIADAWDAVHNCAETNCASACAGE